METGVVLQFEELGKIGEPDREASTSAGATSPSNEAIAAQLADALTKAQKAQPYLRPSRIALTIAENQKVTRFAVQPRGAPFAISRIGVGRWTTPWFFSASGRGIKG